MNISLFATGSKVHRNRHRNRHIDNIHLSHVLAGFLVRNSRGILKNEDVSI